MNWQSSSVKLPDLEARDKPGQRDLRGVGHPAEHAFAEEGAAELHAVEPADQIARRASTSIEWALPEPCSASIACSSSALIQVSSRSAQAAMTAAKSRSRVTSKRPERSRAAQRPRQVEAVERDDRPVARLDPEQLVGIAAVGHREDARGIALKQQARVETTHSALCACLPRIQTRLSRAPCPAGGTGERLCRSRRAAD